MGLTLLNIWMTFLLKHENIKGYVNNGLIKFMIALGFYINLLSAIFYAFMFFDMNYFHIGLM